MYTTKEKRNRIFFILMLIPLLVFTAFRGFDIYQLAQQRVELKNDYAEVNNIKYGLLSVDRWRGYIADIATTQINKFKLNEKQEEALRESLNEILNSLITQAETMVNQQSGKLKKWAFKKFVDVNEVRNKVPEFSQNILNQIEDPKNKDKLKAIAGDKLSEFARETHTRPEDRVVYDAVLAKYNTKKLEDLNALVNQRADEIQNKMYSITYDILACVFLFILLWALVRKKKSLYTPMFVMSTLMALVVLSIGLTVPMIEIDARIKEVNFVLMNKNIVFQDQMMFFQTKSILDVSRILIKTGKIDSVFVGFLVLIFSIVFPITKLVATKVYLLAGEKLRKNKLIHFFVFNSGRWSMADVMVVATFMAYVGFKGILDSHLPVLNVHTSSMTSITTNKTSLQPGFILFITFVLFSLILSEILKQITRHYPVVLKNEKIVAMLILFCLLPLHSSEAIEKQKHATTLIGKDLSEKKFDLNDEVKKNKLTIVNFWETWCGPCKQELPDLEKLYEKNKSKGLLLIGVHQFSPLPKVKTMVEDFKLTFPVVQDDAKSISKEFEVIGTPTTVVLDSNFKILRRIEGIDTGLAGFISEQLKK